MITFYMIVVGLSRLIGEIYQFHSNNFFLFNQIDRWGDRGPQVLYVVATRHQVIKGFKKITRIPVGAGSPQYCSTKKRRSRYDILFCMEKDRHVSFKDPPHALSSTPNRPQDQNVPT